jgi:transposase
VTSDPTAGGAVAEPVRVRRLTDQEGQRLQQIVRRGSISSVRYRRALMLLASAGGNRVPVIAQLVQADEDTLRDVIHAFDEKGLACLDPRWAGGRPRRLSDGDEDFVIATATTRPVKLGQPFTRWSLRKLVAYLRKVHGRVIRIGREALRCLLARRGITFQRTKTWKESPDPDRGAKLDRIEHVMDRFPDRVFAFDEFGPLGTRPTAGSGWAKRKHPDRVPATYHRTHGVRYFHGCNSGGDDRLWGVNRRKKGAVNTLAALKSIRAARPDGAPIYDQAREALLAVEAGGRAAMTELRHVMGLLTTDTPADPDSPGPTGMVDLAPQPGLDQLEMLIARVCKTGMPVKLTVTGQRRPLSSGIELAAYRVVQEALTNTVKHAAGASAAVTVDYAATHLRVEVTDTGGTPGTSRTTGSATGAGRGLIGLRERLAVYGGTLRTGPHRADGYRITALIPLEAS